MYYVSKALEFEAAHKLPNHNGKCRGLHGHTYKVHFTWRGEFLKAADGSPDEGMLIDFGDLSAILKSEVFEVLDHKYLNDVAGLELPTAERLAEWIFDHVEKATMRLTPRRIICDNVQVWETSNSWVKYSPG